MTPTRLRALLLPRRPRLRLPAGVPGNRLVVRELPPRSAARRARALVREILAEVGVLPDDIDEAEILVGEVAANADRHAHGPYELRVSYVGGHPIWCEIVDADPDSAKITAVFDALRLKNATAEDAPLEESGHGLFIVHELSAGRCQAYPTQSVTAGGRAKAVGFVLPVSGRPKGGGTR